LDPIEARLVVYQKNETVFEEDIKLLKLDVMLRDNALEELRKKFKNAEKERNDLKLTLEKFHNSSKNLSNLLESQVSDKTGLGFDSQVFNCQVSNCKELHSQESDNRVTVNPENDTYKTSEGYHVIPPLYTGNFLHPKPNLVFTVDTNASESVANGRFVTAIKLNRGLRDTNYDQLYAYLKQHEAQANKNKMMLDQFIQHIIDPLGQQNRGQGNNARGTGATSYEELRTELGMQIQVKKGRLSVTSATADDCDAFDSDFDEALTAQAMFMANLSIADPVYDEASPSYDSDILSEVPDHDNYHDDDCEHHEVHEMHDDVQSNYVVDSHIDYVNDSNMIPYD
nr:hypothetical protein [Tanacetum cinerariifolium]